MKRIPILRAAAASLAVPALALSLAAGGAPNRLVIVDEDAFGGLNLQPILMLLQSPDVTVLGATIESGDGWQKESVAATLRMFELTGRTDVPVVRGATYPLINSEAETKRWEALYGKLPYKGAWMESWPNYNTMNRPHYHPADVVPPLPEGMPTTKPADEIAADFMVRQVREHVGQVSIVALGPLTNIALAAKLDENFAANAKELVFMGGSFNPHFPVLDEFARQTVNRPRVEFNVWWDPEAAKIVFHQPWKKIVIVPLDATADTRLTPEIAKLAGASGTPVSAYFAKYGEIGFPMWDETAVAVWLDPAIITSSDRLAVDADIDHGPTYGAMLSWPAGFAPGLGEQVATVVWKVDVPKVEKLFIHLITSPNPIP
jgi:inosine-uridine nucleoside N-ribohydrolase